MSKAKLGYSVLLAGLVALVSTTAAQAGECPAGKAAANALAGAPTAPVGVSEKVLAQIDLGKENVKAAGRFMRMRQMTIQPGGIVPLHDHADRPALIMVVSGEVVEYNSKCSEGITHKAGDVAVESLGTKHHWKNLTTKPVELTIGDIVNPGVPATMKEMM